MPLAAIRVNQAANILSVIRLPDSGEEWTETTEFKPNRICYYGTRRWSPRYVGYYTDQARTRLELLLDHGADVNSAMPVD